LTINRGLVLKSAREILPLTLACALLVLAFETLLAYVLPAFQEELMQGFLQIGFVEHILRSMLGADRADRIGPEIFSAIPWAHPVVLAILWTHAVMCATRIPAGEIDRGTVDVLLGMPVTRWQVLCSETVVWMVAGCLVLAGVLAGNLIGTALLPDDPSPNLSRKLTILSNLACLYLASGGFGWMASAWSNHRGRAATFVFAFLLGSFLMDYLVAFWEPAGRWSFLSVMAYYRPFVVLRDGTWPLADLAVLLAVFGTGWLVAAYVFGRRDISTV